MGGAAEAERTPARLAHVVLLGPPGSGKGTQAALLAERLGVPAISTGEMLRQAVAGGSPLGRRVKDVMEAGALVADDLMAEVVRERLAQPDAEPGFLLDGYPRTRSQAATLDAILAEREAQIDCVVYIVVPEETLVRRAVLRGRGADDREEVVRERLRVYREKTEPLVELYRERGLLCEVPGDRDVAEVTASILRSLGVSA